MRIQNFTIGTDFEVVALRDGEPASVINLIGGTKNNPLLVTGGNLQEDNVLAEGATDPAGDKETWLQTIAMIKDHLASKLETLGMTPDYSPVAMYREHDISHPMAQQFGCDPDYNAWTGRKNEPPCASHAGRMRTAGGHVSIGYDHQRDGNRLRHIVKCLDMYLAIPMLFVDPDRQRRELYGKAGSFRPKPFGVEYRALSNVWVGKDLGEWVYDTVAFVLDKHDDIEVPNEVQTVIDSYNLPLAETLMARHNIGAIA